MIIDYLSIVFVDHTHDLLRATNYFLRVLTISLFFIDK